MVGPKEFLAALPKEAGPALAKVGNQEMTVAGTPEDLLREDDPAEGPDEFAVWRSWLWKEKGRRIQSISCRS